MQEIADSKVVEALPRVLILMATYNGERYLRQQIESILNQKGVDVTLLITDDCSTDGSYEIAQKYAEFDSRVTSNRNEANVGVGMNFLNMLYDVEPGQYDYVAFSDQDDVWLDDKLAVACETIANEVAKPEAKCVGSFGIPVVYCSDLQNVNVELENPVLELRTLGLKHDMRATPLFRNYYAGCTMVMNRAMIELFQSYKLTKSYRIHDAWLALVARYCGNMVIDLESARILRRITGVNLCGANTSGGDLANVSLSHLNNKPERSFSKTAAQLYEGFGKYMSSEDGRMIKSFASYHESFFGRVRWALRTDYCGTTVAETMCQKAKLLMGRY